MLTLRALVDQHWEIRNSAALCFTSLAVRITGFSNIHRNNHKDYWPPKSPTSTDFFDLYEGLDSFLLEQLSNASQEISTPQKMRSINPLLGPILAFIGRLQPLTSRGLQLDKCLGNGKMLNYQLDNYLMTMYECAKAPQLAIRRFAAKAIVSMAPSFMWIDICDAASDRILEIFTKMESDGLHWNSVHGNLLQMVEIFNAIHSFSNEIDISGHMDLCTSLARKFTGKLDSFLFCSPVAATFLKLCRMMSRLCNNASSSNIEFWRFYEDVSCTLWKKSAAVYLMSSREKMCEPMGQLALKRAVKIRLFLPLSEIQAGTKMEGKLNKIFHDALYCLTSNTYDMRGAAARGLKLLLSDIIGVLGIQSVLDLEGFSRVLSLLRELPSYETNFQVLERELDLLNFIDSHMHAANSLNIGNGSFHMSAVMKNRVRDPETASLYYLHVANAWRLGYIGTLEDILRAVIDFSKPHNLDEVRYSSVLTLGNLNILSPDLYESSCKSYKDSNASDEAVYIFKKSKSRDFTVDAVLYHKIWDAVFELLEDESVMVRTAMGSVVWKECFTELSKFRNMPQSEKLESMLIDQYCKIMITKLSSTTLTACQLKDWTCNVDKVRLQIRQAIELCHSEILFEEEKSNQHMDEIILIHLAAKNLKRILKDNENEEILALSETWLLQALETLNSILREILGIKSPINALKFVIECFYPLYRLLAVIWAVIPAQVRRGEVSFLLESRVTQLNHLLDSSYEPESIASALMEQFHLFRLISLVRHQLSDLYSHTTKTDSATEVSTIQFDGFYQFLEHVTIT